MVEGDFEPSLCHHLSFVVVCHNESLTSGVEEIHDHPADGVVVESVQGADEAGLRRSLIDWDLD